MSAYLQVRDLVVEFPAPGGPVRPVDGVGFDLDRGEFLALVGESGCGKSLTGLALLQLLPPPGRIGGGSIRLDDQELRGCGADQLRSIRGRRIGMIFQDPMTALNPVLRIGRQVDETVVTHRAVRGAAVRAATLDLLAEVGLPDPAALADAFPHQLSGGMRQRVLIALALAGAPDLLVADEPTTALDVTVQAQILALLDDLRRRRGMALLFITHDFGIVASRADRVAVMYAGQIVECATTATLFRAPAHPYTRALLAAVPRLEGPVSRLRPIAGQVPRPAHWPAGCRFHPRCPDRMAICGRDAPPLAAQAPGHDAACWLNQPGGPGTDG